MKEGVTKHGQTKGQPIKEYREVIHTGNTYRRGFLRIGQFEVEADKDWLNEVRCAKNSKHQVSFDGVINPDRHGPRGYWVCCITCSKLKWGQTALDRHVTYFAILNE
jgi:hypothetical protein